MFRFFTFRSFDFLTFEFIKIVISTLDLLNRFIIFNLFFFQAFEKLREILPNQHRDRPLSKMEALQLAQNYIKELSSVLDVNAVCAQQYSNYSYEIQNSHQEQYSYY